MDKQTKETSVDSYNQPFAKALRCLLQETETTQSALAEYVGVTRQAISKYASGETKPDIDTFDKIVEYFEVSYEYMLGKSNNKNKEYVEIAQLLPLSDKALERILYLDKMDLMKDEYYSVSETVFYEELNSIIESDYFFSMISLLATFRKQADKWERTKISKELAEFLETDEFKNINDTLKKQYNDNYFILFNESVLEFLKYNVQDVFNNYLNDIMHKCVGEQKAHKSKGNTVKLCYEE